MQPFSHPHPPTPPTPPPPNPSPPPSPPTTTTTTTLGKYGHHLHVWDWTEHKVIQDIDLGKEGLIPLELRFLHDPKETQGYVGIALSSNVFRFFRTEVWNF